MQTFLNYFINPITAAFSSRPASLTGAASSHGVEMQTFVAAVEQSELSENELETLDNPVPVFSKINDSYDHGEAYDYGNDYAEVMKGVDENASVVNVFPEADAGYKNTQDHLARQSMLSRYHQQQVTSSDETVSSETSSENVLREQRQHQNTASFNKNDFYDNGYDLETGI